MGKLKTFEGFFGSSTNFDITRLEVGNIYIYDQEGIGPLKVKYLGKKENRKDGTFDIQSEIGDLLSDRQLYVFEWLEGNNSISSWGKKGDKVAIGGKELGKNLSL